MVVEFLYDTTTANTIVIAASYISSFLLGLVLGWRIFKKEDIFVKKKKEEIIKK